MQLGLVIFLSKNGRQTGVEYALYVNTYRIFLSETRGEFLPFAHVELHCLFLDEGHLCPVLRSYIADQDQLVERSGWTVY